VPGIITLQHFMYFRLRSGYYHNGDQRTEDRDVVKRDRKFFNEFLDSIAYHLYVCPITSKALEDHLLFRDYLRRNDWARFAYQNMKHELAKEAGQDKKAYAELKEQRANEFINLIMEKERGDCAKSDFAPVGKEE
jgi:GrpB-like predicted nucleotidyltransferase (UPF0157 family)